MATLTREHTSFHSSSATNLQSDPVLDTNVPAPFPTHLMQIIMDEPPSEPAQPLQDNSTAVSTETPRERPTLHIPQVETTANHEVGPSLTHVQQSCLMTLNNLLSQDAHMWQPIVPTRRHSLPAPSPVNASAGFQTLLTTPTSSSALQTLVSNLRYRDDPEMREIVSDGDASLLRELDSRVTAIVDEHLLDPRDARLAKSLVSLLTHLNRLSVISPEPWQRSPAPLDSPQANPSFNVYDTLSWQVSELQLRRDAHAGNSDVGSSTMQAPVQVVERALLWNKIDQDLDEVSQLCRERTEIVARPFSPRESQLPPEYDAGDYEPPSYDPAEYSESKIGHKSQDSSSMTYVSSSQSVLDEKMKLDLEAVTMAIDRLYIVAPQLLNQRAELKRSKIDQMERAKASGSDSGGTVSTSSRRLHKGKEVARDSREASFAISKMNEKDMRDLDSMLELINKASTRRIEGQSVVLHGESEMAERAEKARLRNLEERDAFHERLVTHSNAGRLTSQDAELSRSSSAGSLGTKTKNPDALLSLPEFIREDLPDTVAQARDPEALLTLPEFVREPPPPSPPPPQQQPAASASEATTINSVAASATKFIKRPFKPSRSRSLSAPPLALARLIAGTSSIARVTSSLHPDAAAPEESRQWTPIRGLDVQFVAEHQENLQSVVVFLQVSGKQQAGINIEAEVVPSRAQERLMIKCGTSTSAPLCLPARVVPGKKEVKVQSGHLEVKLECSSTGATTEETSSPMPPNGTDDALLGSGPLDAAQLKALRPMSFICASCSLPLVQSSRLARYDDLPSEHWAELLEAWMCHADQKVTDRVAQYAQQEGGGGGCLVPARGQALVGGSYVLFESSAVMMDNIRPNDISAMKDPDDWNPVRCICGAVTGRRRQHNGQTTYRLAKYAIRPVSPSSDPLQIPLSAFILQDMDELVHAHATYRFVILDEEDEKPRILIWMFKQFIRISYATSNHYFLARSASVQAAKVHFKILGPSVSPTIKSTLEKYPGFSQSERLLYPLDICRRLAGLLKESNNAYPQGRRIMAGLDVGWLTRV